MKHRNNGQPKKRFGKLRTVAVYGIIVVSTLILCDLVLIFLGIFPPNYKYGNTELGWSTQAPDTPPYDWCVNASTKSRIDYLRNELGIRTGLSTNEILESHSKLVIGAVGDSHSDQCLSNAETHQGVLESTLNRKGIESIVLANGVGRYSPLQAYLLFEKRLKQFAPDVLVLNWYTGNDFMDLLRIDDRPHFVRENGDYKIHPPIWFRYFDPGVQYTSRVLYAIRAVSTRLGIRNTWQRLQFLSASAAKEDQGLLTVFEYFNNVRKSNEPSIGYRGAFAAQFLNQQLYFHHFPNGEAESLNRTLKLMKLIRKENPNLLLVMSPIPSYQLVNTSSVDDALEATLQRLPLTMASGIHSEELLYHKLREFCAQEGWLFVDNLQALRAYNGDNRLYNNHDYHVTATASHVIGALEADVIENNWRD